jgi:large subunit ribosomal protein L32
MRKSGANRPLVQSCPNCGAPRIPHRVCLACGQYGGNQIVKAKSEAE